MYTVLLQRTACPDREAEHNLLLPYAKPLPAASRSCGATAVTANPYSKRNQVHDNAAQNAASGRGARRTNQNIRTKRLKRGTFAEPIIVAAPPLAAGAILRGGSLGGLPNHGHSFLTSAAYYAGAGTVLEQPPFSSQNSSAGAIEAASFRAGTAAVRGGATLANAAHDAMLQMASAASSITDVISELPRADSRAATSLARATWRADEAEINMAKAANAMAHAYTSPTALSTDLRVHHVLPTVSPSGHFHWSPEKLHDRHPRRTRAATAKSKTAEA